MLRPMRRVQPVEPRNVASTFEVYNPGAVRALTGHASVVLGGPPAHREP